MGCCVKNFEGEKCIESVLESSCNVKNEDKVKRCAYFPDALYIEGTRLMSFLGLVFMLELFFSTHSFYLSLTRPAAEQE